MNSTTTHPSSTSVPSPLASTQALGSYLSRLVARLAWLGLPNVRDPRWPVLAFLSFYLVLGLTFLGFNRSVGQIAATTLTCCLLDVFLAWCFRRKLAFPLSALITSCSLSILLNYSHSLTYLFFPAICAIGGKYVVTLNKKHFFNPALFGIVMSILWSNEMITPAPAYQWNGIANMAVLIVTPALLFILPGSKRWALSLSFFGFFTLQTFMRAMIMRHHLPFETLFFGTITSPAFLLFTFFMITDPATTPNDIKQQIRLGAAIALTDFFFHVVQSYYTFFLAAFVVGLFRFTRGHWLQAKAAPTKAAYFRERLFSSGALWKFALVALAAWLSVNGAHVYASLQKPTELTFRLDEINAKDAGITANLDDIYEQVDPRVRHVIKWLLSIGDAVAVGDFDGDGKEDLFLTLPLKKPADRAALYRNVGDFKFARVPLPALEERNSHPELYGLPTNAVFVDYDGDGRLDLLISYAFGTPLLLKNTLGPDGKALFVDVTKDVGLDIYMNSSGATFVDLNNDGLLDLVFTNVLPATLPDYPTPTRLNLFKLPQAEYPGDHRMLHFMHESWNQANNGGVKEIFLFGRDGKFHRQEQAAWHAADTRWSISIGVGDFNNDGRQDLYVANDFGPDDFYLNQHGTSFFPLRGTMFGSIGKDTYKGMNVSVGDLLRTGHQDIYISNVHHALQGEGSMMWHVVPTADAMHPQTTDMATQLGLINENRFGWGAAIGDLNNDGWLDLVQANGMVDDTPDHKFEGSCPDYWYVNEKIARSPPEYHSYADKWGDIRGRCLYGKERNRFYINRGNDGAPQFLDMAEQLGRTEETNSRGVALADFNNTGRLDVVITHMFAGPSLYKNVYTGKVQDQWLGLTLQGNGSSCHLSALGTKITAKYLDKSGNPVQQYFEHQLVSGAMAQSSPRQHIGLGDYAKDLTLEVQWCGYGPIEHYQVDAINQYALLSQTLGLQALPAAAAKP